MTESAERLLIFIEENGGISRICKDSLIDRQVIHSLKSKNIDPSLSTLKKLHNSRPNLDIHWICTGEMRGEDINSKIPHNSIETTNMQLSELIAQKNSQITELNKEKQILYAVLEKLTGAKSLE